MLPAVTKRKLTDVSFIIVVFGKVVFRPQGIFFCLSTTSGHWDKLAVSLSCGALSSSLNISNCKSFFFFSLTMNDICYMPLSNRKINTVSFILNVICVHNQKIFGKKNMVTEK